MELNNDYILVTELREFVFNVCQVDGLRVSFTLADFEKFLLTTTKGELNERLIGCEKALEVISEERTRLLKQVELRQELITALKDYVKVLGADIDDSGGFLTAHNIKSKRIQEGRDAVEKVNKALDNLLNE